MTVRLSRPMAAFAALLAMAALAPLAAQPARRPPRQDTPFLTVQVFRSADRVAGPQASDALRDRLIQVYPGPVLWVIDKERVVELLEQSGYPATEQLARTDENSLAKFLRADEYVRGSVTREDDGQYRIDAQLVLSRDVSLTQPLPPVRGLRADRTAWLLVRPLQDARRQLENEKKCRDHAVNDRFAQAIAEADEAIAAYPNATLVRYCKLNVLVRQGASPEQQIALADEILAIDPNSRAALAVSADAQQALGNVDKANELLVRLLAGEPTNAALANRVVDALAASRQYDVAKDIVLRAVEDNPGDISLIRLKFLILTAAGDYKPAIQTGEELATLDTAMADVAFYNRLTALYIQDSQPTMAVDAARRGVAKFANEATLWQLLAQTLRTSGQPIEALEASKRALTLNPNIQNGWVLVAQGYLEQQQTDSVLSALRSATLAGDNADFIAALGSGIGNQYRVKADSTKDAAGFRLAAQTLQWSDSVAMLADSVGMADARRLRQTATPETRARVKFLLGLTAVQLAQVLANQAAQERSCDLAREADQALITAQIALPAGASFNQNTTVQLMQSIPEFQAYITQLTGQVCK